MAARPETWLHQGELKTKSTQRYSLGLALFESPEHKRQHTRHTQRGSNSRSIIAMPRSRRSQDMDLGGADSTNIQTDTPAVGEENGASASTAGATTAPPAPPAGGNTESFAGDATEAAAQAPSGAQEPPPAPERKARLLITKMEMENFKSYGGVREIGPFHKCFSSIVGPNGSGKSNVIDAMLFVFGKRAKKLRLNKVSELIHRSDTYKNLQYARVSVHFVDILDVEGSEDAYEEASKIELAVAVECLTGVLHRITRKTNLPVVRITGSFEGTRQYRIICTRRAIILYNSI